MSNPSPPNSLNQHVLDLERALGRRWGDDDFARTMQRLQRVSAATASVEEEVNLEVAHLGAGLAPGASDQLASTLPKYYALLLQAWSVIIEAHPLTPAPAPPATLDDDLPRLFILVPPPGAFDDSDYDGDSPDYPFDFQEDDDNDNDNDYCIVYDVNGNVSIKETLSFHECKTQRYDDDNNEEADDCSICLDPLHRGLVATLDCKHEFHGECITTWVIRGRNFCPLCKAKALRRP